MFYETRIVTKEIERLDQLVEDGKMDYSHMAYFRLFLLKISQLVHGDISFAIINRSIGGECMKSLAKIVKHFDLECDTKQWKDQGIIINHKEIHVS